MWWQSALSLLAKLLQKREKIGAVAGSIAEIVEEVVSEEEAPTGPLPRAQENHIRRQIESATSHKVPAPAPERTVIEPDAATMERLRREALGPGIVKAVDRSRQTPRAVPPRRPSKKEDD